MAKPPKVKLLKFGLVADLCVRRFFGEFGGSFSRLGGGYVLAGAPSASEAARWFERAAKEEVMKAARPFDVLAPEYLLLLGDCDPRDNILLGRRGPRFPARLDAFLGSPRCSKYLLRERDIDVDSAYLNSALDAAFVSAFRSPAWLGPGYGGFAAVAHRRLDGYSLSKVLSCVYGKANCEEAAPEAARCLVSVNELVDAYAEGEAELNRSPELRRIVAEVRDFAAARLAGAAE